MKPANKTSRGFTVLETLLVLAVGSTLLIMGLKIYAQWKQYSDVQYLSSNVEQLFTAMHNYYQANCRQHRDAYGSIVSEGTLDPTTSLGNTNKLALTINSASGNTDLFSAGFLTNQSWHPLNALVDNTATDNGYTLQFDRVQTSNVDPTTSVYACPGDSTGPTTCTVSTSTSNPSSPTVLTSADITKPTMQSKVVFWTAHVAVKVFDSTKASAIRTMLNADCVTADPTTLCTSPDPSGSYVVWERPAAMMTENTSSLLWMSLPATKQFNMQYNNDGMSALSGISSSSTNYDIKNYLCGQ